MTKAKKIGHGHYWYKGYQIEEMSRYGGYQGGAVWNITQDDEASAHDATNTLRDAKALIDYWTENG